MHRGLVDELGLIHILFLNGGDKDQFLQEIPVVTFDDSRHRSEWNDFGNY